MKGLGETCKNICRRYGVEVYFRGGSTIRDLLVHPKDRDTILKKSGVIYRYRCVSIKKDCVTGVTFKQGPHGVMLPGGL